METDLIINFSIIIPHKNIPELLDRCLQSIPIRDDVQVIVVDDNSDPDKVDFFRFPGLDRPDTEVLFTKEGKGAGYARNVGLSKAKGKWLVFADADDFFNECLNQKMDEYLNLEYDIIFFQTNSIDSSSLKEIESRGKEYNIWLQDSVENKIILDEVRYRINPPWGKFISHYLIKENVIEFDETLTANDVMFSTKCGYEAKKIHIDLSYLYCSSVRVGSLDFTNKNDYICPRFEVALKHFVFLKKINKEKYRVNIFNSLNMIRKLDNKNLLKVSIIKAYREMGYKNLISDFYAILKIKIQSLI